MTLREKFIEQMQANFAAGMALVYKKNADYAGEGDPFRNFREAAEFAGVTVAQGMRLRIGDKLSRLKNVLNKGTVTVENELAIDTILDTVNYLNILKTWYDLGEPEPDETLNKYEGIDITSQEHPADDSEDRDWAALMSQEPDEFEEASFVQGDTGDEDEHEFAFHERDEIPEILPVESNVVGEDGSILVAAPTYIKGTSANYLDTTSKPPNWFTQFLAASRKKVDSR